MIKYLFNIPSRGKENANKSCQILTSDNRNILKVRERVKVNERNKQKDKTRHHRRGLN